MSFTKKINASWGWVICSLAAIFYCYEYLLRITPSFMLPELMQAFHANATEVGMLSGFFYFVYTPMQIVVGLLSDIYGARRILTIAIITCTLGSYLFGHATTFTVAAVGRSLIGFGSSFVFVCVLKLTSTWLPSKFFALFVGIATALGMLGAIFQVTIFHAIVHEIGWQQIIQLGTITGAIMIPLIWLIIRDDPQHLVTLRPQYRETLRGFIRILRSPQMWLNGIIAGIMYLSLSLFAELWGISFLQTVHHLDAVSSAHACSMVYLGWLIGGPLIGYLSDRWQQRKSLIMIGCAGAMLTIIAVIYGQGLPLAAINLLIFAFGFCSSAEVLCFAISNDLNSPQMIATATAFTNCLTMFGGFAAQPLIGKLLDLFWQGEQLNQLRIYSCSQYQLAFLVLPVAMFCGFILSCYLQKRQH